jgi:predicted phage terminase large subunit-like protein
VFEAQYLNFVNNPALQILSTALVQYIPEIAFIEGLTSDGVVFTNPYTGTPESLRPILVVDPAISLRAQADYTAIVVGGFSSAGNLVALEFSVGHYAPEKTMQEVARLATKWKLRTGYCETVAFQVLLHQKIVQHLVKEKIKCGILPYTPNKMGSKLKRIEVQLSPLFTAGRIIFSQTIKTNNLVMNTFNFFGRGGRDDPPDALAVIAEKSKPPTHLGKGNKRYLSQHTRQTNRRFNKLYGGIY